MCEAPSIAARQAQLISSVRRWNRLDNKTQESIKMDQIKFNKLPKWAKEEIEKLQRKNINLMLENERLQNNFQGTGHFHCGKTSNDEIQTDFKRVTAKFNESEIEISIVDRGYDLELELRGLRSLNIKPGVSNTIYVTETE